jgi:hypothetical protein
MPIPELKQGEPPPATSLVELALLFLKLGATAFGGERPHRSARKIRRNPTWLVEVSTVSGNLAAGR